MLVVAAAHMYEVTHYNKGSYNVRYQPGWNII